MRNDVMLDLETLGTDCIVQIGACYFQWNGTVGKSLLLNINLKDSLEHGRVDSKQLKWWIEKSNLISWLDYTTNLNEALNTLTKFLGEKGKETRVWSHFYDIMVLENVCKSLKRKMPFLYGYWREINTLMDLSGIDRKKGKDKTHNALDDCVYQVDYCTEALKEIEVRASFIFKDKGEEK